jgi:hypothetical protein
MKKDKKNKTYSSILEKTPKLIPLDKYLTILKKIYLKTKIKIFLTNKNFTSHLPITIQFKIFKEINFMFLTKHFKILSSNWKKGFKE